jgi:YidC/Oxa1 family membrane protein insertase
VEARFTAGEANGRKIYQTDYRMLPQTIAPGATVSANARLFAGAKDVSVVGYERAHATGDVGERRSRLARAAMRR